MKFEEHIKAVEETLSEFTTPQAPVAGAEGGAPQNPAQVAGNPNQQQPQEQPQQASAEVDPVAFAQFLATSDPATLQSIKWDPANPEQTFASATEMFNASQGGQPTTGSGGTPTPPATGNGQPATTSGGPTATNTSGVPGATSVGV